MNAQEKIENPTFRSCETWSTQEGAALKGGATVAAEKPAERFFAPLRMTA
jgi:hypothetical protein